MSVHWPIIRTLLTRPGRVGVVDDKRSYRNIEILVAAMHVAAAVRGKCASPTMAVLTPTSGAFAICALAGWMLGKTVVPLNYLLKRDELQYVIDDCGADTVVTVQPMLDFMGYQPRVEHLVRLEDVGFAGVPEPVWPASASDDELAVLLYTSGTSGKPKGVMLTHGNLKANLEQVREWVDISPADSVLGVLPQFHSFGLTVLTLLPLTAGMGAVYTARFVPHKVVKLIRDHRPTIMVAIPSMYGALLSVKDGAAADFASLRLVVSGGEPLPDAVRERFRERFGVTINEGYGLTETAPVTNWCRPEEWRAGSVGMPLPRVRERIVDLDSGKTLGAGEEGEIQIAGPNVMRGYFNLPEETRAAFTADGFLRTGDIGRFDDAGHLSITGRLKEMLIVGGENVFPREIEEALLQHPSVGAAGVVGMRDEMRGEQPVAFVEMKEGEAFDEMALLAWCRGRLAGYKVPREVRVMEALPRNATGKIMRRELKKLV